MCGAFRLARFNVQASRPRILAEGTTKVDKKSLWGSLFPCRRLDSRNYPFCASAVGSLWSRARANLLFAPDGVWLGLLSLLMISTLRFSSFKTVGTRSRSMRTIILAVAVEVSFSCIPDMCYWRWSLSTFFTGFSHQCFPHLLPPPFGPYRCNGSSKTHLTVRS